MYVKLHEQISRKEIIDWSQIKRSIIEKIVTVQNLLNRLLYPGLFCMNPKVGNIEIANRTHYFLRYLAGFLINLKSEITL